MNYIKHLNGFFECVGRLENLRPTHISLYLALFMQWNKQRFENPLSVHRSSLMKLSKIGSQTTYHKCLVELHRYQLIIYQPSRQPLKGSIIRLIPLDAKNAPTSPINDHVVIPSINETNKNLNDEKNQDTSKNQKIMSNPYNEPL